MKLYKSLFICTFSISMLYAEQSKIIQDDIGQENKEDEVENGLFLHGGLEVFNKTAFSTKQVLPNNSYGYVLGQLNIGYKYNDLEVMVGAVGAGLTYDSTNGLAFNYVGAYPGYLNNMDATADNTHRMFVHNAFVKYETNNMNIKVGRFAQENDIWLDSYVEGINAIFKIADNYHVKLFGVSTMALVGNGWLTDFSTSYSTYGVINAEVGYENDLFETNAYVYYGHKEYVAPGFDLALMFGNKEKISYTTKLAMLFPIHSPGILDIDKYFFGSFKNPVGFTSSIFLREDIDIFDTYKVALGIYKNIGNANARMGLFGNPIGIDIWDNSIYENGAINASVSPDALNILLFTEARYSNLAKFVKNITFGINGRYTTAPSANEYSLNFICNWQILNNVSLLIIANYYTHVMKNNAWNSSDHVISEGSHTLDRSYLMTSINYMF